MCENTCLSVRVCMILTSFRLEVGDAVHNDMVKEQGFVVDLDVSREQAAEVLHISEQSRGREKKDMSMLLCSLPSNWIMTVNVLQQGYSYNPVFITTKRHDIWL